MWYVYILAITTIGHHAHGASLQNNGDNNLMDISDRLAIVVQKKCLKNANETISRDVVEELKKVSNKCWGSVLLESIDSTQEERGQHCHGYRPLVAQCLATFGAKLEACLNADEIYLKEFILVAFDSFSFYFCDSIRFALPIQPAATTTCVTSQFLSSPEKNPHMVCYARSKVFGDDSSIDTLTKEELCRDLQNIKSCYEEFFDQYCPDASEFKEFQLGMQKAGLTACADVL